MLFYKSNCITPYEINKNTVVCNNKPNIVGHPLTDIVINIPNIDCVILYINGDEIIKNITADINENFHCDFLSFLNIILHLSVIELISLSVSRYNKLVGSNGISIFAHSQKLPSFNKPLQEQLLILYYINRKSMIT